MFRPARHQRARVRRRIAALAIAGALLTTAATAAGASAAVSDGLYGVNVQQVFSGPSSSWQPRLAAIQNGGLDLGRIDARWQNVEPNPPSGGGHSYNWSMYDSIAQAMAQHNIRWYPIIDYSTNWSGVISGDSNSAVAPEHAPDFAAYAGAFAKRYGRGGTFWQSHPSLPQLPVTTYEIWNEENSTVFWRPQDDAPERYADLYMSARDAIRGADSQAGVVIGGLALGGYGGGADEIAFVQRMYAHRPDLANHVDGVGLHPYQANVADTEMRIARFRQALDQVAGPQVPIEITEVGWSSTAVSDADRGSDLAQLAQDLPRSDCNVDRFLPYTWITEEQDGSDSEHWFGIANADGTLKPSGQGYVSEVKWMESSTAPSAPVTICHQPVTPAPISTLPPSTGPHPPKGPRLILSVRHNRGNAQLEVRGKCPSGCRLRIDVLKGRAETASYRLASKRTPFSKHRQVIRIRLPRKVGSNAKLVVVATGKTGASTKKTRGLRIR